MSTVETASGHTRYEPGAYRHEALFWSGIEEFVAGTAPFVAEGVEAGEPVLVAVPESHWTPLRAALGSAAAQVEYVDMTELGRNPARIIPRWREFVDAADGQPSRGVGEPIWPGRRSAEVEEGEVHEALLNLAIGPDTPLRLRCPYDMDALGADVLAAARRSHPILVRDGATAGSPDYGGSAYAADRMGGDLPAPAGPTRSLEFGPGEVETSRRTTRRWAEEAGLPALAADDLALAAHEVMVNSLLHGGGTGRVETWRDGDAFVCEIRDGGRLHDPLAGRRQPDDEDDHGRGLWMANQLCDLVQLRTTSAGTVVRLVRWL